MKRFSLRFVALMLSAVFALTAIPMVAPALAEERDSLYYHAEGLSYKELTLPELIEKVTGSKVSAAEERYLLIGGESFRYTDRIPTASVSTDYQDGTLTVTAKPYSYTAVNGEPLSWIPKTLKTADATISFTEKNGSYFAKITDADVSRELVLTVEYRMTVSLKDSVWTELANRAYNVGAMAVEEQKSYEKAYEQYLDALEDYDEYLKALAVYEQDLSGYNEYLVKLENYKEELEEYTAFVEKKAAYDQAVEAYQKYLADQAAYNKSVEVYQQYLSEKQKYDLAYPEYQKYLTACKAAMDKLFVMDALYQLDSAGHRMYSTLMGNTVATVVSKKDQLIAQGGCDARDIDNAQRSTVVLQELLTEYKELEEERERFAYYCAHYEEIRDNFIALYSSLNSLYKNGPVRAVLNNEGRLERYQNFIAHLYVISTSLDDNTTLSDDWVVYKANKPLAEVLVPEQYLEDRNAADPQGLSYPAEDVPAPVAPAPVEAPTNKPAVVTEPTKTWVEEVKKPNEPEEVVAPIKPQAVIRPTEAPQQPTFTGEVADLAKAVAEKALTKRDTAKKATITLSADLSLPLVPSDYPTVAFYDWDGTLLKTVTVEHGDAASYGKAPTRPSTAKNSYDFDGWVTHEGALADLSNVLESLSVYAQYTEKVNSYTIKWNIDNKISETTVLYGEMPVPPIVPTKESDERYHYTFSGWVDPIVMVTGNAEYTAKFEKTKRVYTVTFLYLDQKTEYHLGYGEELILPTPLPEYRENGLRYFFEGWDKEPTSVTGDVTYTAVYKTPDDDILIEEKSGSYRVTIKDSRCDISALLELAQKNNKGLTIHFPSGTLSLATEAIAGFGGMETLSFVRGAEERKVILSCESAEGTVATLPAQVLVQIPYTGREESIAKVFLVTSEGEREIATTVDSSRQLSFWSSEAGEYLIREYHSIDLAVSGAGIATLDKDHATAGETVTVDCTIDPGMKIAALVVRALESGEEIPTNGYSFVMPEGGVKVEVSFEAIRYTVRFIVDGREYAVQSYGYGETVVPPQPPSKEAEEGYEYTFRGWSPTVEMVTEDAEYTAQFKKNQIEDPDETYKSPYNSNKIFTIYLPIAGGVLLVLGVAVAAFVIVKKVKKKKID